MGGTSKSQSSSTQESQLAPYQPAQAGLEGILSGLQPSVNNLGISPTVNDAFGLIQANASQPNPFTAPATGAALSQLNGGPNIPQATNTIAGGYDATRAALNPYTSGNALDPSSNPALAQELGLVGTNVANTVNPMFSAAGRLGSPDNYQAVARGIAQGSAPILANAAGNQINAAGILSGAANSAGAGLTNADVANSGILGQGINNAPNAYGIQNLAPETLLAAAIQQGQLPIQNAGLLESIYGPLAATFGKQTGSGTQQGTQTMSGAQQFALLGQGFNSFLNPFRTPGTPSMPS